MGATTIWERWDGQKPDSTFHIPGNVSQITINRSELAGSGFDFKEENGQMTGITGSGKYTIVGKLLQ